MTINSQWTEPFHDTRHHGEYSLRARSATVTDWGEFADLVCWTPGLGFNSPKFAMESVESAMAAGEAFVSTGVTPNLPQAKY